MLSKRVVELLFSAPSVRWRPVICGWCCEFIYHQKSICHYTKILFNCEFGGNVRLNLHKLSAKWMDLCRLNNDKTQDKLAFLRSRYGRRSASKIEKVHQQSCNRLLQHPWVPSNSAYYVYREEYLLPSKGYLINTAHEMKYTNVLITFLQPSVG